MKSIGNIVTAIVVAVAVVVDFELTLVDAAVARTFTDDLGVTHTFTKTKPKVVAWSHIAISLAHLGMESSQLAGVYGQWGGETSNLDPTNPELGSSFESDPTAEDIQFLAAHAVNLSPNCLPGTRCEDIDLDLLRGIRDEVDVFITIGYRHTVRYITEAMTEIESILSGKPIIYIDLSQTGPDCLPTKEYRCYGKSMIDLILQLEELATAMGVTPTKALQQDQQDLCEAAANFQSVARDAQLRGVRVMAAYFGFGIDGATFLANPPDDMVLRMLEELGMPLLHVDCELAPDQEKCPLGFFWETVNNTVFFDNCQATDIQQCNNENPKYPVDLWLYDDRQTLDVLNRDFASLFPDKAVLAGQIAYWPIGGGALSYRHATEILNIIASALANTKRLYDGTQCVSSVDVSGIAHRTVGLKGGEYACYDERFQRQEYLQCPVQSTKASRAAIIGGSIGGAVGGLIVLVGLGLYCHRRRHRNSQANQADHGMGTDVAAKDVSSSEPPSISEPDSEFA
ncbi:hypothetical protein IV203_004525 [Nitzschia inconspicua]|uniref:Uncharacterized protein n=1 Tax=Nitzschia inconspicua TaxID=303405 RepID=A0A9K3PRY5_9STRA|nr:hypothetical protein IV203_004525 [Nitzschia inconspicua]